jgi:hypothetical protein
MLFLSHLRVARNNRDPADFCLAADAAAAAEMLSADRKGHSLLEFLHDHAITKLYLDHETYFEQEPTEAQRLELEAAVRGRVDKIIGFFAAPDRPLSYSLATRHGYCPTRQMHKLSFRPFPQGMRLRYTDIPKVLRVLDQDSDGFWDMSVYKPREQLLACVHGAKGADDPRVLCPEHPDDDPLLYVAQHWDEAWPLLDLPPDYDADCDVEQEVSSDEAGPIDVPPERLLLVRQLLSCLSATTADDRAQWVRVATLLKRLSPAGALFADFVAFSSRSAKFAGEADCRKTWDSLSTASAFGAPAVGLGTLRFLAHRDDPEAYARIAAATPRPPADAKISTFSLDMGRDLAQKLRDGFQAQLGDLSDDTEFTSTAESSITFRHAGVAGRVEKDYGVYLGDEFVGSLVPDVPVKGPMTALHKSIAPSMDFVYNRDAENTAHLRSVTPNTETTVRLYNIKTEAGGLAQIIARGAKDVTVNNQKSIDAARSIIFSALQHHGTTVLGDLNQIFIGTLNVYNSNADPDAGRRDDEAIGQVIMQGNTDFLSRVRFVPDLKTNNCNGLFFCDPVNNIWSQMPNPCMESLLLQCVNSLPEGALNEKELRHVKSHRGCKELLYSVARKLVDLGFADKLDSNIDLFALDNVVVNAKLMTRGAIVPESNVQTTTGWSYDAALAAEYRTEVDTFFARVMPVEEERRVLLSYFASSLTGKRVAKKILALTDRRAGNNGKSTLVALMRSFFGAFSTANTKFVCAGSFQGDRNSHDAGLEPFRSTRLIIAEELKNNMTLDTALLKMLSGGTGVVVEGRKFGQGDRFKYVWQANIVLIFNEGDCPQFDSGDSAFMQRLLVAPMRSKFVAEMPAEPEEHTFLMDGDVSDRFPLWRSALLDLLLDHFDPKANFEKPPDGMQQWGHAVTTEANPLADWMQQHVKVTGDKQDYVLLSDIVTRYKADVQLARQMSVTEFKRNAKAFIGSVALSLKAIDNIKKATGWSSAPNVAKGVILINMA